jgi:hypothetical protein
VFDALSGADVAWKAGPGGSVEVVLPSLHMHAALVFEGTA